LKEAAKLMGDQCCNLQHARRNIETNLEDPGRERNFKLHRRSLASTHGN
jgi:hypothetical protein